jgi:hypothetical protein
MVALAKRICAVAVVAGLFLEAVPVATAQIRIVQPAYGGVNPNPQIAPGVSLLQYNYTNRILNNLALQQAARLYLLNPPANYGVGGYNPQYFQPSPYNPYAPPAYPSTPYGGGYSPYGSTPYAGGYSAGGIDPLTGQPTGGGYSANPYSYNPYSGGYGIPPEAAALMAYGQLGLDQEKARILRETANQARLDTRKKVSDTLAYLRANEYTFTKEQADIAKRLLDRSQKTPTQTEITTGKSLNVLLKDLVAFNNQELKGPTVMLDEDVLRLTNVSGPGSSGNIGLLRNNGQFTWPSAFDSKDVISEKDRKDLNLETAQLYDQARVGTPDANLLRNVETSVRALRANLKKVTTLPSNSYLEGQRFLDDFDAAVLALKKGDLALNLDFQKFAQGGKSVQELVDYLGKKGLQFAPASTGDDRAYVALQAALSAHSLTIHGQVAASGKGI